MAERSERQLRELETAEQQPDPMAMAQYELVRMNGNVLVQFVLALDQLLTWVPEPGWGIGGPCAARYRILPDGPWIVYAFYPDGYPGPRGALPQDAELHGKPGIRKGIANADDRNTSEHRSP